VSNIVKPGEAMAEVQRLIKAKQRILERVVPKGVDVRRLIASYFTCAQTNPRLMECSPASQLMTVLNAAQVGLELGGPLAECYPVPYKNRGQYEAQLQVGYRGFIKLAKSSGQVTSVFAAVVHKDDEFEWQYGTERSLRHRSAADADRSDEGLVAAYCLIQYSNGQQNFLVMWLDELLQARTRSPQWRYSKENSIWGQHFAEMCRKTVTRKLLKYEQLSPALARAVGLDEAAENGLPQEGVSLDAEGALDNSEIVEEVIELRLLKEATSDQLNHIAKGVLDNPAATWPDAGVERTALLALSTKQLEAIRLRLGAL